MKIPFNGQWVGANLVANMKGLTEEKITEIPFTERKILYLYFGNRPIIDG